MTTDHARDLFSGRVAVAAMFAAPVLFGLGWLLVHRLAPTPMWNAVGRIGPAGLLLLALCPRWPSPRWLARSGVLGALNFAGFFALQAASAHRLPAGVAATIASVQALLVPLGAVLMLGQRITTGQVVAGAVGISGIGLLATTSTASIDAVGVATAVGTALCAACGLLLTRKWGVPDGVPHTTATAWQMLAGVAPLALLAACVEGSPPPADSESVVATVFWLVIAGTAIPFALLFGALHSGVAPAVVGRAMLLTPLAATAGGWIVAGQSLSTWQVLGVALVLGSAASAVRPTRPRPDPRHPDTAAPRTSLAAIGK